jgi:hypothetical protein
MSAYARALVDELLGINRNNSEGVSFTDTEVRYINEELTKVCKFFLVRFCPYQVFSNTKSDLGPCSKKHHEEYIRKEY